MQPREPTASQSRDPTMSQSSEPPMQSRKPTIRSLSLTLSHTRTLCCIRAKERERETQKYIKKRGKLCCIRLSHTLLHQTVATYSCTPPHSVASDCCIRLLHVYKHTYIHKYMSVYKCICQRQLDTYLCIQLCPHSFAQENYGVAASSRRLKIVCLFCRICSLLEGSFAKTYTFKEPTNRSQPILA